MWHCLWVGVETRDSPWQEVGVPPGGCSPGTNISDLGKRKIIHIVSRRRRPLKTPPAKRPATPGRGGTGLDGTLCTFTLLPWSWTLRGFLEPTTQRMEDPDGDLVGDPVSCGDPLVGESRESPGEMVKWNGEPLFSCPKIPKGVNLWILYFEDGIPGKHKHFRTWKTGGGLVQISFLL